MERSRHERGRHIKLIAYSAGALCLAAVLEVGALVLAKNKRTPQERGGWTYIDLTDEPTVEYQDNYENSIS